MNSNLLVAPLPSDDASIINAYGEWAAERSWDHIAHLSIEWNVSKRKATTYFEGFVRRLEQLSQQPVNYLGAIESAPSGSGLLHIHAVLDGTREFALAELTSKWRFGHSEMHVYRPELGGARYACKGLTEKGGATLLLHDRRCIA